MAIRILRIVFFLVFFFTLIVPYGWGEVKKVTILYSNNINGQIYPAG